MSENEDNQNVDDVQDNTEVVASPKSLDNGTYNLDNITQDLRSARIISSAYASRTGELNAILEYMYEATIFDSYGQNDIANTFRRIAMDEMEHFDLLAKTLIRLGVAPIYTAFPPQRDMFYSTRYVNYCSDSQRMLSIAIQSEEFAIKDYTKMLSILQNNEVKNVISFILEQEKGHLETLKNLRLTQN